MTHVTAANDAIQAHEITIPEKKVRFMTDVKASLDVLSEVPTHGNSWLFISAFMAINEAKTLSRDEIWTHIAQQMIYFGKIPYSKDILNMNLTALLHADLLQEKDGKYALTAVSKQIADVSRDYGPRFQRFISEKAVIGTTIGIHIASAILKIVVGVLSKSAAIFSDGIDEAGDGLASIIVGVVILLKVPEIVSTILILLMMVVSAAMVGLAAAEKIIHPSTITDGAWVLGLSILAAVILGTLGIYQNSVGRRHGNFSLVAMAVDSRNHVLTSIMVSLGVILSMVVDSGGPIWLLYADVAASLVIGLIIIYTIIDLAIEVFKPKEEQGSSTKHVHMHFIAWARRRALRGLILQTMKANSELHSVEHVHSFLVENVTCTLTPMLQLMMAEPSLFETLFSEQSLKRIICRLVRKKLVRYDEDGSFYLV